MADYTYGQLEQLWIKAGGPKVIAPLMAAIALAESSGNPQATNPDDNNGTQTSWGLWQISNGTHNPPSADILTPLGNARAAVAKYRTQGLGAWGTYDSGAYKQFYKGDVPPSSLPQGGTPQAQEASVWQNIGGFPIPGFGLLNQAVEDVWGALTSGSTANPVSMIAGLLDRTLHAVEWFFVPDHWVRLIAAGFGLLLGIPGLYALIKTGSGGTYGDVSLALGILLVTLSGMCFFIAFHNLPQDVTNFQSLLGWMSEGIRTGKAPSEAPK